jgi:hypothetical protein
VMKLYVLECPKCQRRVQLKRWERDAPQSPTGRLLDRSRRSRPNAGFCYQHVHAGHEGADSSVHAIRPPQLAASFVTDPFPHSSIVNPRASS